MEILGDFPKIRGKNGSVGRFFICFHCTIQDRENRKSQTDLFKLTNNYTNNSKPNVSAKKTVCLTSKLLLFSILEVWGVKFTP